MTSMELFGAKFSIALGAWRLRFVLMLEEPDMAEQPGCRPHPPHHVSVVRDATHAR